MTLLIPHTHEKMHTATRFNPLDIDVIPQNRDMREQYYEVLAREMILEVSRTTVDPETSHGRGSPNAEKRIEDISNINPQIICAGLLEYYTCDRYRAIKLNKDAKHKNPSIDGFYAWINKQILNTSKNVCTVLVPNRRETFEEACDKKIIPSNFCFGCVSKIFNGSTEEIHQTLQDLMGVLPETPPAIAAAPIDLICIHDKRDGLRILRDLIAYERMLARYNIIVFDTVFREADFKEIIAQTNTTSHFDVAYIQYRRLYTEDGAHSDETYVRGEDPAIKMVMIDDAAYID